MGTFSRHVNALLRRNFIYRKRSLIQSTIQLILPSLTIAILVIIRFELKDTDSFRPKEIPAVIPTNSWNSYSFGDYITTLSEPRVCVAKPSQYRFDRDLRNVKYFISGIDVYDWPVPFLKCNARHCEYEGQNATDSVNDKNWCEYNILAVAPALDSHTISFVNYILKRYPLIDTLPYNLIKQFDSEDDITSYITASEYGQSQEVPKIAIAVVFEATTAGDKQFHYKIRTNSTNVNQQELRGRPVQDTQPSTRIQLNTFAKEADQSCDLTGGTTNIGPQSGNCFAQYMYNGALATQRLVNDWILDTSGSQITIAENGVSFVNFPSRTYTLDGFYAEISRYAGLLIVMGLLYPISSAIRSIITEKETRQKELMKMMSVSDFAIGLSWFISLYAFFFVSGIFTTITTNLLYPKASVALLFVFWQIIFMNVVVFAMTIATLFSKATRGTLVGMLVFFVGYFLTLIAEYDTGKRSTLAALCIHPVTALSYALQIIGNLEEAGVGLTSNTLGFSDVPSGYSFNDALGSLLFDIVLWGFFCYYCNRVIPGDYGQALPWNFMCQKSFWCRNQTQDYNSVSTTNANTNSSYAIPVEEVSAALAEQEQEGKGVHIRGLVKKFGDKTAVDNLNLSMYSGQVFALLGHNGAGKTTTINILTGMVSPTSGTASIGGKSILTQMSQVRDGIGICPQHDCLFPLLTVKEHIEFFARVKGLYGRLSPDEVRTSVETSVEDVALSEKMHTFSKDLSGGMKRKLSLAIAFCGDSKIVFLDEPTSGMDPFSRRFAWNVIQQNRQDRCIVLTTHFMDEADILGDKIAIMAEGQLRCCGSSFFLKKHYGVGYTITIEKEPDESADGGVELFQKIDEELENDILKSVPKASILSNTAREMTLRLPVESGNFVTMFHSLDKHAAAGKISTYGVSNTTLDEVFLMVARGEIGRKDSMMSASMNNNASISHTSYRARQVDVDNLFLIHTRSLFLKRAINFKRDKKAWVCSTILPSLFAMIGFLLVTYLTSNRNMPPLELKLSDYNRGSNIPSAKRNPIPFGNSSNFVCQPSTCMASTSLNFNQSLYCGEPAKLDNRPNCWNLDSVSDAVSKNVEDENDGTFVINQNVSNIEDASTTMLPNNKYAASQYGAIYMTHNEYSNISTGNEGPTSQAYNDLVQQACLDKAFNNSAFNCSSYEGLGYVVSTNFTALHASLLFQTIADEAILRTALSDKEYEIKTTIHPLPITKKENGYKMAEDSFTAWFLLVLSFPFITGAFATFIVQERMSKAKHLQTVAGVKPEAYWLATYLWDIMNYQFPLWIVIILMLAFNVESFTTTEDGILGGTIVTLMLFGPAAAGFTYIVSFLFKSPSNCSAAIISFNFFVGLVGPLVTLILRIIHIGFLLDGEESNLRLIAQIIEWILRIFPSFNMGKALLFATNIEILRVVSIFTTGNSNITVWSADILLIEVIYLGIQSVLYVSLAVLIDRLSTKPKVVQMWKSLTSCKCFSSSGRQSIIYNQPHQTDEDVQVESDRVGCGEARDDLIVLQNLIKEYPNGKVAVNNLSLGIPAGQCFGLLGINGAGKTTTMSMLTAEFPPTSGDALLASFSVTNSPEETRRLIGYCPQFDAHFMNLTGKEHVRLYAGIKGVPAELIDEAVRSKLTEVGLNEYDSDRLSSDYSGGMKRKLSVACATIGGPQIVFLDEPSTGMDPVSRRDLWNVISDMVVGHGSGTPSERTSAILTTHSMEECEALCPRIGIMAGGKLKCLGSAQRLKSRYGKGYQIELKVMQASEDDNDVKENFAKLISYSGERNSMDNLESGSSAGSVFFNLEETRIAVERLTSDDYLSQKIVEADPIGYLVYKNAKSNPGVAADELAAFCTSEIRLRAITTFFKTHYPDSIFRERQDTKMRFEVPSDGTKISHLFETIEENKMLLRLSDYGVSQTTLEQVFNMHAAAAEQEKVGRID